MMPIEVQTAREHVSTQVFTSFWKRRTGIATGSKEAIKKELDGVLANGTWDCSDVIPRDDLMKRKEPFNIGKLMTILSVKPWESPSLRKLKARIACV